MTDYIVIQMYHNHPPVNPISEIGDHTVWCKQIWDSYQTSEAIAWGCFEGDYDKAEQAIERAHAYCTKGYTLPEGNETGYDVFLLIPSENLKAFADKWADFAIKDLPDVGGDDTYFDYFPDFLSGLYQLCTQLDYHDPYNRFLDAAESTGPYKDDPDEGLNLFSRFVPED